MKFTCVGTQSGSYGNLTISRGRAGQYIRARVIPLNPQTDGQQTVRSRLANLAKAWRGLTDALRNAWDAFAENAEYIGTGYNAFVGVNGVRVLTGGAILQAPPALASHGMFSATGLTATVDAEAGTLSLSVEGAADTDAPDCYIVEATKPASAGRRNLKSSFRVISPHAAIANLGGATSTLGQAFTERFGLPALGTRIKVRVAPVKDGQQGVPFVYTAIVAAA